MSQEWKFELKCQKPQNPQNKPDSNFHLPIIASNPIIYNAARAIPVQETHPRVVRATRAVDKPDYKRWWEEPAIGSAETGPDKEGLQTWVLTYWVVSLVRVKCDQGQIRIQTRCEECHIEAVPQLPVIREKEVINPS